MNLLCSLIRGKSGA